MALTRAVRIALYMALALVALYLLLMVPLPSPAPPSGATGEPFLWDRDARWAELEARFNEARTLGCEQVAPQALDKLLRLERLTEELAAGPVGPDSQLLGWFQAELFNAAALVAACPTKYLPRYRFMWQDSRRTIKHLSRAWDLRDRTARDRIYQLLYGGRAALEEILLQAPPASVEPMSRIAPEAARTPSARVLGITVHSGDILLSRGAAPTSALIARGSDFPGNFSHVALVHVDAATSVASIIEAHIEQGVTVSTLRDYLGDRKLRVLVLRLRAGLPELLADPMLPHTAATAALEKARASHIPYDFAMDAEDDSRLFCSEVALAAYRSQGVELWQGPSTISAPGLVRWLAAFGVTHFQTFEPSDLEYDPQLSVVAEWLDPEALWQEHLDNAVIDAMLEAADAGLALDYSTLRLPLARVAKAYSWLLNRWQAVGPVPEGMTATAALRNQWLNRVHGEVREAVETRALRFAADKGYRPPYWELVRLSREVLAERQ